MSVLHRSHARPTIRAVLVAAAIALTGVAVASPAQAHEAPKAGSTCAMSGTTEIVHGKVYVCTSKTATAKPRWGKGLTISKSGLTTADTWAKAADKGMSAAFGMIKNPTAKPVRIIGAYSTASNALQLHEVVENDGSMVMQQKAGGFVIPAGGMLELKPGGSHIMFMDIKKPLKAGTMVPVTLITADGGLLRFTALVKVYAGANETYNGGTGSDSGMSGM
jgi:periplasmic copper chaperone A